MSVCLDNNGTVMIGEENYEVVDECTGEEETPEEVQEPQTRSSTHKESTESVQQLNNIGGQSKGIVQQSNNVVDKSDSVIQQLNFTQQECELTDDIMNMSDIIKQNDSIDFTADISLDRLDVQKEMTDEDVMNHLDVIENIELDHETFGIKQPITKINQSVSFIKRITQKENEKITVNDKAVSIDEKWYKSKIAEKEALVKERLSKLARVLGISYPHYEKWLERIEKKEGSPMCVLDPTRRCLLDKPHTNRWKFGCIRKDTQLSVKEEGNPDSTNIYSKSHWHLQPTGAWSVNVNNVSEFPSFVLQAVKIFEEFLQSTIVPNDDAVSIDSVAMSATTGDVKKNLVQGRKQQWLWLLVRCNSMDELMLFATGKNISRDTMDRLKQTYESGPGKDCNVKSLYCKSINKCANNKVVTNTTFLVGAEALDEVVGSLKVQLSPKTNFWSNAAGATNVAKTVMDMLKPTPKVTVLEIGCGVGVIGLMMASKCREVIEVDTPSEIEEAETTCVLNNITNVSFIMGYPSDVVNKISAAVKNRVTYAIVNANTNMGRAVEVMTCLRKLTSLRRIVMVTMLTKQSVRTILELARPIEDGLGHPFMPTRACVVDTLPIGPHFETVILMEPRLMHRLTQPWFLKKLEEESKSLENTKALEEKINSCGIGKADTLRKNPLANIELVNKSKSTFIKKASPAKSGSSSPMKGKIKLKREHSPDIIEIPKKIVKKYEKTGLKSWQQDVTAKKQKNWLQENSTLRINPLYDKKLRDNKEHIDLREKLSSNKIDNDLIQKVNESREILEAAKEKLSGPSPKVDATTAKELQNVLSLVLEQTNKFQNQVSRSVWDRIAPPETTQNTAQVTKELDDDLLLKGRFVQETRAQDIVITTTNKEYLETDDNKAKPPFRKYHNLAPLEPNTVMPVTVKLKVIDKAEMHQKPSVNRGRQQSQVNFRDRNKDFSKSRWNDTGGRRKSPSRRLDSSYKHRVSPPRKLSPKRPLLTPPRRPSSSPYQTRESQRECSPQRRLTSSPMHISGGRHQITSSERPFSLSIRAKSPSRRPISPSDRSMSPLRQQTAWRQMSPMRHRLMSPIKHQVSPQRRTLSPIDKMVSPSRPRGMMPVRRQSPMKRSSPRRIPSGHSASPTRSQISPLEHQSPPQNRFADDWDIPSRSSVEQINTWQRHANERLPENVWRDDRQPTTSGGSWQILSNNDRYRNQQQDRSWDARESTSHGNSWGTKQPSTKLCAKEQWMQNSDGNRWSSRNNVDNWDTRMKESLDDRKQTWMDADKSRWEQPQSNDSWNQGDKEDWNDLPEDARDPWGDESNLGLKDRWLSDNQVASSSWLRETDKADPWMKPKDNWQTKSQAFSAKQTYQSISNPNMNDSRWLSLNDANKKSPSTSWQGGANNVGAWQQLPSSYNFQSQRSFNVNLLKDRR